MRLFDAFNESVSRNPGKIALITEKSQLSFADLRDFAHACEVALLRRGLRQGLRLVLDTDRPEFVLAFALLLSRHALTVVFAPLSQVIAAEIEFDLAVVMAPNPTLSPERQVVIEPDWFAAPLAPAPADFAGLSGGGGAFVHTSSGTTGRPKFIRSSEARQMKSIVGRGPLFDGESLATMRMLSSVSAQISWGLLMILRVLVGGGSAVALGEHRNRPLQYIDLYGVTYFVTTPAVARQMFEVEDAGQYLASLRCIRIGGAMCSAELLRRLMALGHARVAVGYGAAEFGELCVALLDPAQDIPEGYIGEITRPEFEIAFFDDRMQPLPGASEGIVGFRDTSGEWGREYLNPAPGDQRAGFIGGYFFPGDIMRRDGQSLFLIGRIKNIINVSGNKISLDAVQAVLEDALAVSALACFAEPDALGLERLVLAYAAEDEIAPEAAEALLGLRFPGLALAAMHRLPTLPIGPSGKIDMAALGAELRRKPTVATK